MKCSRVFLLALFLLCLPLLAQTPVQLKIYVVLIDKDLNQKPVPRFALTLRRLDAPTPAEPLHLKTALEGFATAQLPAGSYHLSTPDPIEFQGKKYRWELDLTLAQPQESVELSNDNATVSAASPAPEAAGGDELRELYQRLRHSVVRIRAERGGGTGVIVDSAGLILTNQHVVENSDYLSVQFDEQHKVRARLLSADVEKDIAVLWANLSAFPQAVIVPPAGAASEPMLLREGERVFVIGSPLHLEKVLTAGVVSRVEPNNIVTDVSISPGNSGSPLFNSVGQVVGIATARMAGVSRMVPIQQALPVLEQARTQMPGAVPPEPRLLPVEPTDYYPAAGLRWVWETTTFDSDDYYVPVGPFRVGFLTPVVSYYLSHYSKLEAARRQAKRAKKDPKTVTPSQEILEDAHKRRPVLFIHVAPKVSAWRPRFKADFLKMRLLCGDQEVEPIHPFRMERTLRYQGDVSDTSLQGFYTYSAGAIAPSCPQVVVQVYSEKEPHDPHVLVVDPLLVSRIWRDFDAYRKARETKAQAATPQP